MIQNRPGRSQNITHIPLTILHRPQNAAHRRLISKYIIQRLVVLRTLLAFGIFSLASNFTSLSRREIRIILEPNALRKKRIYAAFKFM